MSEQEGSDMVQYARCPRCGHLMLPVLDRSPCGHSENPALLDLEEPGVVYSWTTFHLGGDEPVLLAMADFFGGALRVTAPVLADHVEIGDAVIVVGGTTTPHALRPA